MSFEIDFRRHRTEMTHLVEGFQEEITKEMEENKWRYRPESSRFTIEISENTITVKGSYYVLSQGIHMGHIKRNSEWCYTGNQEDYSKFEEKYLERLEYLISESFAEWITN